MQVTAFGFGLKANTARPPCAHLSPFDALTLAQGRPLTSHISLLTSHSRASGSASVVLLPLFKLHLRPNRLNLPPLPLSPADEIANEKPFENGNQRHRENEKDRGERREVEQKAEGRVYVAKGFL